MMSQSTMFDVDVFHLCLAVQLVGFEPVHEALQLLRKAHSAGRASYLPSHHRTLYWESPLLNRFIHRPDFVSPPPRVRRDTGKSSGWGYGSESFEDADAMDGNVLLVNLVFFLSAGRKANHDASDDDSDDYDATGLPRRRRKGHAKPWTVQARLGCITERGICATMSRSWTSQDWIEHWAKTLSVDLERTRPARLAEILANALQRLGQKGSGASGGGDDDDSATASGGGNTGPGTATAKAKAITALATTPLKLQTYQCDMCDPTILMHYPELNHQSAPLRLFPKLRHQALEPHVMDIVRLGRRQQQRTSSAATVDKPNHVTEEQMQQMLHLWRDCCRSTTDEGSDHDVGPPPSNNNNGAPIYSSEEGGHVSVASVPSIVVPLARLSARPPHRKKPKFAG